MASPAETIGAVLIGLVFAIWLSSSAMHLAGSYIKRTADPYSWIAGVILLTIFNTAHTAILCYSTYDRLIVRYGEEEYLSTAGWPHTAHLSLSLALSLLVHLYFLFRISLFFPASSISTRVRRTMLGLIGFFTAGQVAFGVAGIYYTATGEGVKLFEASTGEKRGWLMLGAGVFAVLCDVLIFVSTFKGTRTARNAAQDETFPELFSRLVIQTNFVPAVCSILALAFYLAWDTQGQPSGVSTAISIVLPKLYLISMLSSVNRGVEPVREGPIARMMKHASSLSDMFKGGPPVARSRTVGGGVTVSKIGTPRDFVATPIADLYGAGAAGKANEEDPGWLRRTFASPDSNHTHDHGLVVPLQPFAAKDRPLTSLSISDYGDYFSDDKVAPSQMHADSGSADEHAHQGHSTSIDVQSQTPTPRRATFGRDADVVLNGPGVALSSSGAAGVGAAVGATAGRQPVRYGYL